MRREISLPTSRSAGGSIDRRRIIRSFETGAGLGSSDSRANISFSSIPLYPEILNPPTRYATAFLGRPCFVVRTIILRFGLTSTPITQS